MLIIDIGIEGLGNTSGKLTEALLSLGDGGNKSVLVFKLLLLFIADVFRLKSFAKMLAC